VPVLIDSKNFTQRITNIVDAIENDSGAIDDGIRFGLDKAKDTIINSVAANPETYAQVGFSIRQFAENISRTFRTGGRHAFGIFDTDIVGDEGDIEEIFGVPGLWHGGTGRFDLFRARVLASAARREQVTEGRLDYWGEKTPQWVFLNAGFSAVLGDMPSIAGVEPTSFVVESTPSNFIAKATHVARDTVRNRVQENMQSVFRSPDGRFAKRPASRNYRKTPFGN